MKSVVKVATTGPMKRLMKEAGTRTKWTDMAFLSGRMAKVTKVNSLTTSVKVKVHSYGLMDASISVNGRVASNTEKAPTLTKMVK